MKKLQKKFDDFLKIPGKTGIFSHNDLDGIASSIFLAKILKKPPATIKFHTYQKNTIKKILKEAQKNKLKKIFILDMGLDTFDPKGFAELSRKFHVLLIDHHPSKNPPKNSIKTPSTDCVALTIYKLSPQKFQKENFKKLLVATLLSEFSYKNPKNLALIKKLFPSIKNPLKSELQELSINLSRFINYSQKRLPKTLKTIEELDMKKINKKADIIKQEINSHLRKINTKPQVIFYKLKSKYSLTSPISTALSVRFPKKIIVIAKEKNKQYKISLRTEKNINLNKIIQKISKQIQGIKGGGHKKAAGVMLPKSKIQKFLKLIKSEL